ncbi:glycosyltransferase [Bacillota bacterium LCP21S3_F9]
MKVLFLTNIPSPYRVDFFNEFGRYCNLTVAFEGRKASNRDLKWKGGRSENYREVFLRGVRTSEEQFLSVGIIRILKEHYDYVIVGGYSTPTGMLAIEYMRLKKIPFLIEADGGLISQETCIKRRIKMHFISAASGWLSSGNSTTQYLAFYGAKKECIHEFHFSSLRDDDILPSTLTKDAKKEYRMELGMQEDNIIISVGKFSKNDGYRKGFDVLMRAMTKCPRKYELYIIGDTPTPDFITLKKELGLTNVFFVPFKEKEILKKYYYAADIFCLPTREDIWGLVINEAMGAGLPVITTDRCVAGMELIRNGWNGYLINSENVDDLAGRILELMENEKKRVKMSERCLANMRHWTIENMAQDHYRILKRIG